MQRFGACAANSVVQDAALLNSSSVCIASQGFIRTAGAYWSSPACRGSLQPCCSPACVRMSLQLPPETVAHSNHKHQPGCRGGGLYALAASCLKACSRCIWHGDAARCYNRPYWPKFAASCIKMYRCVSRAACSVLHGTAVHNHVGCGQRLGRVTGEQHLSCSFVSPGAYLQVVRVLLEQQLKALSLLLQP
jgi:hypothetical protein